MNNENLRSKNKYCFSGQFKNHVLLFLIFTVSTLSASAQTTYTVTSNADISAVNANVGPDVGSAGSGVITLRSALEAATNASPAAVRIIIIPASITVINLTLGQINVGNVAKGNTNITVNGPGKGVLTINQTTLIRIFSTNGGAITFSLNDLKLNYAGPVGSFGGGGGGAIASGGTGASTSLTNVAITNFKVQSGAGGAILCTSSGTANALTVTNCDFTNNKCGSAGGAIYYTGSTTCTITGCTFTSDSTGTVGASSGGSGGAISTSGIFAGSGTSTITKCTFIDNHSTLGGGAITNAYGLSTVSYCRFIGNNSATPSNGNTIYESGAGTAGFENITADNNWWGVNSTPATPADYFAAGAGVITLTKSLQLKLSASATNLCNGVTSTITASFLSNSSSEVIAAANLTAIIGLPISFSAALGTLSGAQATIQAAGTATATYTAGATAGAGSVNGIVDNVPGTDATAMASVTVLATPSVSGGPAASTSCAGLGVTFTATVTNQTSIIWQESANVGFSSPTTLTTGGIYSIVTNTLNISDNTSVNGKYYRLIASNVSGCPNATSAGVLLTATTPTLSANNSATLIVGAANSNNIYYAAACGLICRVAPSGATPVSGSVISRVWVEPSVLTGYTQPFVQRHYQVTPAISPATSTGTVTLYFSQTEFNNFNAAPGSVLDLPTGPADAAGKANLRVAKYAGSSSDGSGLPATYSSGAVVLDPPDANIVWNATFSRWEVTVDVTGFSGFIVQTSTVVLPIKLISFTAQYSNNAAKIKWEIAQPEDGSTYQLQRSDNASSFTTINTQQGDLAKTQFNYTDPITVPGKWYYRVQMTDRNGKVTYSDIIFVRAGSNVQEITIYPNPVKTGEDIKVNLQNIIATKIELNTSAGQQLWSTKDNITGSYSIHLPFAIAKGVYVVKIYSSGSVETRKIMIE